VALCHRYIGEATSRVYEAALFAGESLITRCWDPLDDIETRYNAENDGDEKLWVSEELISNFLPSTLNLKDGLAPPLKTNGVNGNHSVAPGTPDDDVDDDMTGDLYQHLDLIVSDSRGFLQRVDGDTYSIPISLLTRTLLQNTMERHVTARFGQFAARIIRMLTEHGIQDEKFLAQTGILKSKEIRALTNILLKAGLIDTQEVPRDANRTTNRILWLYSFNSKRARLRLCQESYQAMKNLLRRIEVERKSFASVLRKPDRLLNDNDKQQLANFQTREERMIGMLERLDDYVACLGSDFMSMEEQGGGY
jgi:RNA polymerase III subunit RPC82